MGSYKSMRVSEDVMRELTVIIRELKDPRIDSFLSVVRIELTSDLDDCKVFVSSLHGLDSAKTSVEGLVSATGYIRRELGKRLQLRKLPNLHFVPDDSIEHGIEISKKLDELLHKKDSESDGTDH